MTHRDEVIAYLRHLADTPDGVRHRSWLFDAAMMLDRHQSTVFVDCRVNGLDAAAELRKVCRTCRHWYGPRCAKAFGPDIVPADGSGFCHDHEPTEGQ